MGTRKVRSRNKTTKRDLSIIEALQDWLLEDSISFRKLDGYRQQLKLDKTSFSTLLGISPGT